MSNLNVPFNITILELNESAIGAIKPVRSLDIFDGATKNFHEDGLFSISIFGRIGEENRNRRFSYIDIKVPVLHPQIYAVLGQLKHLYHEILSGKGYAIWDEELKDFVKSDQMNGRTGYNFFLSKWKDIQYEQRNSEIRDINIGVIKKYMNVALTDKVVVMPAGLREYEIEADGRESEDEFNNMYRRLLMMSNSIVPSMVRSNIDKLDNQRYAIQMGFNKIYDSLQALIEGKRKLLMGGWASRAVWNGTRNVITTTNITTQDLNEPGGVDFNHTVVGLFQYLKATLPVTKYQLRSGFLSKVFTGPNAPAFLVDKKTLKKVPVKVDPTNYDDYMTDEGLDRIINLYGEEAMRHKRIEIEGHWLGLIYKGEGTFKIIQDIEELPDPSMQANVTPLTFTELMYLSVYEKSGEYPAVATRYPVTGYGSIYPCMLFLKPTIKSDKRAPLGDDWEIDHSKPVAINFPSSGDFFNAMSPNPARLAKLGADFDGDKMALVVCYSQESRQEIKKLLNSRNYYVGTDGRISFSLETDTVRYLMKTMTGHPVVPVTK